MQMEMESGGQLFFDLVSPFHLFRNPRRPVVTDFSLVRGHVQPYGKTE